MNIINVIIDGLLIQGLDYSPSFHKWGLVLSPSFHKRNLVFVSQLPQERA
jgi:hypothetical protein